MNHTRRNATVAGGLAIAGVVMALGIAASLGVTSASALATAGEPAMRVEATEAAIAAEIEAVEAGRASVLEGIGVVMPSLSTEEAASLRERAAGVIAGYVAAYADGAQPEASVITTLNAEYDAILGEFGIAPPELSEEQIRTIAEQREADAERLNEIYEDAYGDAPGWKNPVMDKEDAAALEAINAEATAIAESFGIGVSGPTVVQEVTLASRLAPFEPRYAEVDAAMLAAFAAKEAHLPTDPRHAEAGRAIDALNAELDVLYEQHDAIVRSTGLAMPELSEEEWADFEEQMLPLNERAEEIYTRLYASLQ